MRPKLKVLLQILQQGDEIEMDSLDFPPEGLMLLERFLGRRKFLRKKLFVERRKDRPSRRKALLRASPMREKRRAEGKKAYFPEGGPVRKAPWKGRITTSRYTFHATAVIESTTKSGVLSARLLDPEPLRSVTATGTVANAPTQIFLWGTGMNSQSWVESEIDPARVNTEVFRDAYVGDLNGIVFEKTRIVTASTNCFYQKDDLALPMQAGMNFVCQIRLPDRLRQLAPPTLTLFGPFRLELVTGNVDLRTTPQFDIKVGHLLIRQAFLAIRTEFTDEAWDTFASINGVLELFGEQLPVSSDLPIEGGIASFNLETLHGPVRTDLQDLVLIANSSDLFSRLGPLPKLINQYWLERLNLTFDGATGVLLTLSMRILSGNSLLLQQGTALEATVDPFTVDWQIGYPESQKIVTVDGEGKGRITGVSGVAWEVGILTEPEFCVQFWADSSAISADQLTEWLKSVGETNAVTVANYCGCLVAYYLDRTEIYVGDEGLDFPKVYPKS